MLHTIVDSAIKSKLPAADYPVISSAPYDARSQSIPASNVIVFVVGGATYEEAKELALSFNQGPELRVVLGGNCIHNSKSFLADISQL